MADKEKITKYRDWLNQQSDKYMELEKNTVERGPEYNAFKWAYQFALDEFDKIFETGY